MKALITGATGFIGSFLAEHLVQRGYEVTCLVRKTSNLRWLSHLELEYLYAGLEDVAAYSAVLKKFDYIFHLAGRTKATSENEFYHANAECTQRLVSAVAGVHPELKRFIHVSSLAAAGPATGGIPLSEESGPGPVSAYGRSKLEGERAVLGFKDRMAVTVIRPPAVYGPRDTDFFLIFKAAHNRIFPYWGRCTYSLIYVQDLVKGIALAAESKVAAGKTYYLADSRVYSNDDILKALSKSLGNRVFRLRIPAVILPALATLLQKIPKKGIINADKIQEIRYPHWTCDPATAERDLGFRAETPLWEGFNKTADWYRKEKWL